MSRYDCLGAFPPARVLPSRSSTVVDGAHRLSQVPGETSCFFAAFLDPGWTLAPCHCGASMLSPQLKPTARTPATLALSGLDRAALMLAVYASQAGLLRHHARLASGRWPTFAGRAVTREVSSERF